MRMKRCARGSLAGREPWPGSASRSRGWARWGARSRAVSSRRARRSSPRPLTSAILSPSMAPRPLEAVFFDVGGTLIAPRPSFPDIYSRVLVPLGIRVAAGDFQRAARETWVEFDALVGRGRDRYSHFEG